MATPQGNVIVSYRQQVVGNQVKYVPTGLANNVTFTAPAASGPNVTGNAQVTYAYQLQGNQLVANPISASGQATQAVYGQVANTPNTYLGSITYNASLASGQPQFTFASFNSANVSTVVPNYVTNPMTGQVIKIGVGVTGTTSYNQSTNQVSVNWPANAGQLQAMQLYTAPQIITPNDLKGGPGNLAVLPGNLQLGYNVTVSSAGSQAYYTGLGASGTAQNVSTPTGTYSFSNSAISFAPIASASSSLPLSAIYGANGISTGSVPFIGSAGVATAPASAPITQSFSTPSQAMAYVQASAASAAAGTGNAMTLLGSSSSPYQGTDVTASSITAALQNSINRATSVTVTSSTPGYNALSYTGKPLNTNFVIAITSPAGTSSLSSSTETVTPTQAAFQRFIMKQQTEERYGIGNKEVQGITDIAAAEGNIGLLVLGPGNSALQRLEGIGIAGLEVIGIAMPSTLLAGGLTLGTLAAGTTSSAATGALTTEAYSTFITGKPPTTEQLLLSSGISALSFAGIYAYGVFQVATNPLISSESRSISLSSSGKVNARANLLNVEGDTLVEGDSTGGNFKQTTVNTYRNIFTGNTKTILIETSGDYVSLGNGRILGAKGAFMGDAGISDEINIQLITRSQSDMYSSAGKLLKTTTSTSPLG